MVTSQWWVIKTAVYRAVLVRKADVKNLIRIICLEDIIQWHFRYFDLFLKLLHLIEKRFFLCLFAFLSANALEDYTHVHHTATASKTIKLITMRLKQFQSFQLIVLLHFASFLFCVFLSCEYFVLFQMEWMKSIEIYFIHWHDWYSVFFCHIISIETNKQAWLNGNQFEHKKWVANSLGRFFFYRKPQDFAPKCNFLFASIDSISRVHSFKAIFGSRNQT